jgi:ATP-dependent helicase/nuclease subunit A
VSGKRRIPDIVLAQQADASDPAVSAWVSANAGAGKTHVLAQRVIRLLLAGADPEKILCITFTKAAASNMAKRVFDTLAQWTALDDAELAEQIRVIASLSPDENLLKQARRLFARALETPGGLKVQTVHAFCTRLLQQFPFEANVAARFDVLDAVSETQLLDHVSVGVLLEAARAPESPIGRALSVAVAGAADQTFRDAINEAIRKRDLVRAFLDHGGGLEGAIAALCRTLGIGVDETIESIDLQTTDGPTFPLSRWNAVAGKLAHGSSQDKDQALKFEAAALATGEERAAFYRRIFLTDKGEPRQRLITRAVDGYSELAEELCAERARVSELAERRKGIVCRDRTAALVTIADAVIKGYETEKERRGLLDYDDLIDKSAALLESVDSAWVHYKLDLGIDHVLIDEAQDTSPKQWRIVNALVGEFFAGAGARTDRRTIFAVGDEKQSIFSFQGADPAAFDAMRRTFASLCRGVGQELRYVPFRHSFRSGPNVLGAVDKVFSRPEAFGGLSADHAATVHEALPDAAPGLVEVWETIEADKRRDIEAWDAPFDDQTETSPAARLAQRIARNVHSWRQQGTRPGDVLILVRQRGSLFEAIIRALKDIDLPVAGADRLILTEHIAVMDLIALADAILLPENDLALASVLKSPLFGLDDDDLFEIAWRRKGSLRAALRSRTEAPFASAARKLDRLAEQAARETPFGFYAGVLGPERGRKQFLSRLGPEVADALDEFLNLALEYEKREPPSLQGFLAWLRATNAEIKRDMQIARDEVRVMTVHGAKGLEARTVILADTTTPPAGPPQRWPRLLLVPAADAPPSDHLIWIGAKPTDSRPMSNARARHRMENENEYRRLLYVAMTRAIDRLIVCGAVGARGKPPGCWYDLVHGALAQDGNQEPAEDGNGAVWRFRLTRSAESGSTTPPDTRAPEQPPPQWLEQEVSLSPPAYEPLAPANAYDETHVVNVAGIGIDRAKALARGEAVHRLLQSLPAIAPDLRGQAARDFLARRAELEEAERVTIIEQVLAVLGDARFGILFGANSRAEVPIVGRLSLNGRRVAVAGQIDRLVVSADRVLIADYKTNRPPPPDIGHVPAAYVAQLALYRAVLGKLYAGRPVGAVLLWTEIPGLTEIPADLMEEALARLTAA